MPREVFCFHCLKHACPAVDIRNDIPSTANTLAKKNYSFNGQDSEETNSYSFFRSDGSDGLGEGADVKP